MILNCFLSAVDCRHSVTQLLSPPLITGSFLFIARCSISLRTIRIGRGHFGIEPDCFGEISDGPHIVALSMEVLAPHLVGKDQFWIKPDCFRDITKSLLVLLLIVVSQSTTEINVGAIRLNP